MLLKLNNGIIIFQRSKCQVLYLVNKKKAFYYK